MQEPQKIISLRLSFNLTGLQNIFLLIKDFLAFLFYWIPFLSQAYHERIYTRTTILASTKLAGNIVKNYIKKHPILKLPRTG